MESAASNDNQSLFAKIKHFCFEEVTLFCFSFHSTMIFGILLPQNGFLWQTVISIYFFFFYKNPFFQLTPGTQNSDLRGMI